jgi:mannosyltransferase OCH1-like enzyme
VDAWVSKAIRRLVILSLAVHLVLLVKNSSKSTAVWLDSISTAQYMEDVPTLSSWGQGEKEEKVFIASSVNETTNADVRAPRTTHRTPLEDLIQSDPNATCPPGKSEKYLIESTLLPENMTYSSQRKIPKTVHVTSKTRCMTPAFIRNIDEWRFPDYALYFHDDAAVDRLLAKFWPEFPHLQLFQQCSISGAAKADIWRLLVLWEYGGIYTGTYDSGKLYLFVLVS